MPTITPATVDRGIAQYGKNAAERAVLRIASPMPTGKTLIKRNGEWYCKQVPSQRELDEADHYFLGGHFYDISEDLLAEIQANVGTECMPTVMNQSGLYPAEDLLPSTTLYPRSD